ncbi:MAG: toll/interleukin-1 receptor domain-containing protein [Rhodobacteraceae bacterium]|nr:toll/interleukin-1 receptor domain-containing protein [Paracoccaceae bacterium]
MPDDDRVHSRSIDKSASTECGPEQDFAYRAFISYSHSDSKWARWLHSQLESYRLPPRLVGQVTSSGKLGKRVGKIFRDRDELPVAADLSGKINEALRETQFLIVLCSRASARSKWVNQEIINFKRMKGAESIVAVIVDGEPFASATPGRESEECFPEALRFQVDSGGNVTTEGAEPIAADLRPGKDSKRLVKMKVLAGLLGVSLDELIRRDNARHQKRLFWLSIASVTGMAAMAVLSVFAITARNDAERQKHQAEDLIEFMIGDLRAKLEPVGRLDVLDSVGEKALAYFATLKPGELDADTLGRRARALHLLGEISDLRGDADQALTYFTDANLSTEELLRRAPNDAQRIFEHAQSTFWLAQASRRKGDFVGTERLLQNYEALANQLVDLNPNSAAWRSELAYSNVNLGVFLSEQRRFDEAVRKFSIATSLLENTARKSGPNSQAWLDYATSLAWLADTQFDNRQLSEALNTRNNELDIYDRFLRLDENNAVILEKSATCYRALGAIALDQGLIEDALRYLTNARETIAELVRIDPENMERLALLGRANLEIADANLVVRDVEQARINVAKGASIGERLMKADPGAVEWRVKVVMRSDLMTSIVEKIENNTRGALARIETLEQELNSIPSEILARSDTVLLRAQLLEAHADLLKSAGQHEAAAELREDALRILGAPARLPGRAQLTALALLVGLDREGESRALASGLVRAGYRRPFLAEWCKSELRCD